ncbi:SDR family NAD(P)-dependent oxidoreductase [Pseudomonas syringae]|uniref:SDR family NAD(P)-dependent oxidoreductase n=1 Tax=Pseudomonas syringae TaxID=317 RepID=UPI00215628A1|nr:SDR family NAD(P)-dependent oxidoreductase [Pseudomonas syringae]
MNIQGLSLGRQPRHDNGEWRQKNFSETGAFRGQVGALGECHLFIVWAVYALSEVLNGQSTFEDKTAFAPLLPRQGSRMKKTVLITGASSGFGLMLATHLHQQGFNVVGTSRYPERYASSVPFKLLRLDVDDDGSIQSFTEALFKNITTLDVLVNNAGYMVTGLAEETPIETGRQQFETNFWGTVKVTNAVLPHLRQQKAGQIITVSSMVGLIGPPNLSYYSASKHAVEGYFKSLRFELSQFNINVSVIEPGWFKTNLGGNAISVAGSQIADYDNYRKKVNVVTQKGIDEAESPQAVVNAIVNVIATKKPPFSHPVAKMAGMILFLQRYLPSLFESAIFKSIASGKKL